MEVKLFFFIRTFYRFDGVATPLEIQQKLDEVRRKLKKYEAKKMYGVLYYELNENDPLYNEARKLEDMYPDYIFLYTEKKAHYSDDELNRAVAFIPDFTDLHMENYGDDSYTHYEACEVCGGSELGEKWISNPDGKTKKLRSEERLIKCGETVEEVYGISQYMFDKMSDDYLKKGFKPIYSMRGKEPFGYGFYGEKEIELYNDEYYYEACECCGKVHARDKDDVEEYCEFYVLKKPDFKEFPVCFSQQYYYEHKKTLISPELYRYLISRIKDAEFIPVFLKEE